MHQIKLNGLCIEVWQINQQGTLGRYIRTPQAKSYPPRVKTRVQEDEQSQTCLRSNEFNEVTWTL